MGAYATAAMDRFTSFDGTGIAYTVAGEGPDALLDHVGVPIGGDDALAGSAVTS